jgi:predicted amidohydrolase YtcJ
MGSLVLKGGIPPSASPGRRHWKLTLSTPAWAAGMEDRLGKLVPGFAADLVVVDFDPFHCDPSILPTAQASATMLAGEWVWQS